MRERSLVQAVTLEASLSGVSLIPMNVSRDTSVTRVTGRHSNTRD